MGYDRFIRYNMYVSRLIFRCLYQGLCFCEKGDFFTNIKGKTLKSRCFFMMFFLNYDNR